MATYFTNTTTNGAGVAFTLASNDTIFVGRDAYVVSTGSSGIVNPGSGSYFIDGSVFGVRGLNVGSDSGSFTDLTIGATGTVTGIAGAEAVSIGNDFRVVNYGEIRVSGSAGYGFFGGASGTFTNFGSVNGAYGVVFGNSTGVSATFINYGEVVGSSAAFTGGGGNDRVVNHGVIQGTVSLAGGNDTYVVADGRLYGTLDGGNGSDTISFEGFGRGIIADIAVGLTWDGQRNQVINNVENATGGSGSDIFFGSEGDNVFDPGSTGADQIFGYGGNDTVSYVSSIRSMIIDLTAGATWDGVEGDTLSSIESAIGSRFNDTIYGTSGDNVIDGGPEGADTLFGLGGIDTISYATSERSVIIDLNAGATWDGLVGDVISGFENATGSAFNDSIYGDGGSNVITGGRSVDTIYTGAGNDRIVVASFSDLSAGRDIIADFATGSDKLVFSSGIGYSSGAGFIAGAAPVATNGNAVFLYNTTTGFLSYDADGNGAGAAATIASFTNLPTLGLSDFIFV